MVLAAQYESLLHPLTVLLAVPLAVTGALAALWLAGSTLNVYSQVGMILLIGLVSKNSILLVTYANDLRARGRDAVSAMLEAGRIRLRPILMTSVATIFGVLPIALGLGAGASSRRPLGYAIIGGMTVSTVITLLLVPAVFVIFERLRRKPSPVLEPVHRTAAPAPAMQKRRWRSREYPSHYHIRPAAGLLLVAAAPDAIHAQAQPSPVPTITLAEARSRAAVIAPGTIAARAELGAAVWERRSASASLVTPNLTAATSYTRFSSPFFNFGTGSITPNATSATLQASYTLFGARKFAELTRARASVASAEAEDVAARFETALMTDRAFTLRPPTGSWCGSPPTG
jgi:hypothetical protein